MNIRTNNLGNKVIAIIVVMLLTMSDFLFVGASTVSYAINNAKTKLNSNTNYDMCIDEMLFKIWEEIDENNSRS